MSPVSQGRGWHVNHFPVWGVPCLYLVQAWSEWPSLAIIYFPWVLAVYLQLGTSWPSFQQGCFFTFSVPPFDQGQTSSDQRTLICGVQVHTSQDILASNSQISHQGNKFVCWWMPQKIMSVYSQCVWDRLFLLYVCQCPSIAVTFQLCPCSHPVFLNRYECWVLASIPSIYRSQGDSMCTR